MNRRPPPLGVQVRVLGRCAGLGLMAVVTCLVGNARGHDFRLYTGKVEEDGFTREISYFQNSDHTRVQVNLPVGWVAAADSASLTLSSPTSMGSLIRLENSRLTPDLAFKDQGLETYRKKALSMLPEGAADVRVAEERADLLPIFRWKSYEFVVAYTFFGETYRRGVLFLDLNATEQVVVTSVATAAEYGRVHNVAFDLLRSWQTLPVN